MSINVSDTKQHYEEFYKKKDWNNSYTKTKYQVKAYLNVVNIFSKKPIKKVLDVGCGTGIFTHVLSEMGYDVTGIDFAQSAIDKANEKYPNYTFSKEDATNLHLKETFDLIFVSGFSPFNTEDFNFTRNVIAHWSGFLNPAGTIFILGRTNLKGENSSSGWFFHSDEQIKKMFSNHNFSEGTYYSYPIMRYLLLSPIFKNMILHTVNRVSKILALSFGTIIRSMTVLAKND